MSLLRLAVTLGALALVVRTLGSEAIMQHLRGVAPGWVALSVLALSLQILLSALRWRITAGALGLTLGQGAALREYYLSVLANTLLPGGVLGDVSRIARMRQQAGLGRAAESVGFERLAGQIALALAALAGVVVWFWPAQVALWVAAASLLLPALVFLLVRLSRGRVVGGPSAGIAHRLHAVWLAGGIWRAQLGLSAAILACNIGGFWAAAQAIGLSLSGAATLLVIPATLATMLLPVSVNGWGVREAAAAALWPAAGVAPAEAVAASVVFGLSALLASLPGLLALRPPGRLA